VFLVIACILAIVWLAAVVFFKMTKGVIHLVLVIAVIALIVHFVRHAGVGP